MIKTCFSNGMEECDVIRDLYDCMKTTAAEKTQEYKCFQFSWPVYFIMKKKKMLTLCKCLVEIKCNIIKNKGRMMTGLIFFIFMGQHMNI